MEIVHDKITYFNHVVIKLIFISQELVSLQLPPCDLEQFLKELSESREV